MGGVIGDLASDALTPRLDDGDLLGAWLVDEPLAEDPCPGLRPILASGSGSGRPSLKDPWPAIGALPPTGVPMALANGTCMT